MASANGPEPSDLRATAYHEAGHGEAAWWKWVSFREVSITPGDHEGTLGHLLHYQMHSGSNRTQCETVATSPWWRSAFL